MKFQNSVNKILLLFIVLTFTGCNQGRLAHFKQFYSTRLNAAYHIATGSGEKPGFVKIIFITEVKYKDLLFIQTDSVFRAEVKLTLAVNSTKDKLKTKIRDRQKKIEVASFPEAIGDDKYVRFIEAIEVEPDEYNARVMVTDGNAKSLGLYLHKIELTEIGKPLTVFDPVLVQDSLAMLSQESIVPLDQKVYSKPIFAMLQIAGIEPEEELVLDYNVRDHQKKIFFKNQISTRCSTSVGNFWLRLSPENIALGASTLHISASQGTASDSSKIRLYSQYNFTDKQLQNISFLVEPLKLIMPKNEWKALSKAEGEEQNNLFKKFWKDRNPDKHSDKNMLLEEFFYRVEDANRRFRFGSMDGWRTDRGRIYLINGPPDNVRHQYSQSRQAVYEIWEYREQGITYYFRDDYGNGDYRLMTGIL